MTVDRDAEDGHGGDEVAARRSSRGDTPGWTYVVILLIQLVRLLLKIAD